MIIKMTLHDNYYTQILERYIDDGGPFVQTYHNSESEYKQFRKDVDKFNTFRWSFNREEFKTGLENTIKQTFSNYLDIIAESKTWRTERFTAEKIKTIRDSILKRFQLKLVNLVVDKSFNMEVVYYFDFINKYITV